MQIEGNGSNTSRPENQGLPPQSEKPRREQTCNWSTEQRKSKRKRQITCKKNFSERGDCIRWITKSQCSLKEACAVKHNPNKKGKEKGRPRNSKGDGKSSDDGSANRQLCTNFKRKEAAKGGTPVIVSMFPNVQNSKRQVDADSETSVHTHTQQKMLIKRNQHR